MSNEARTTVYYNSACPVCDAGISAQKNQMGACNIAWVDVHTHPEAAQALGVDLEFVRERLHVMTETGRIRVGAPALAELWARTPGQGWLARIVGWRVVRPVIGVLYNAFARVLYRWNRWRNHW